MTGCDDQADANSGLYIIIAAECDGFTLPRSENGHGACCEQGSIVGSSAGTWVEVVVLLFRIRPGTVRYTQAAID